MPKKETKKKVTKPKVVKLKKKSVPKKAAPKKTIQTKITPAQQFTNTYHVNIQTENLPPVYYTMPTMQMPTMQTQVPTFTEPKTVKVFNSISTNTESEPVRYFESISTNTDSPAVRGFGTNTDSPSVSSTSTNTEPKPRRVYATASTSTEPDPILTELPIRVTVKRKRESAIKKEGPPKKRQYAQETWDYEPTHFTMGTNTTMGPDEIPVPVRRIVTNKRKRKGPTASIGTNTGIEQELSGNTDPSFFSFDNPMRSYL